jgi:predicted DCC family thiol-disulfide oxidoreductase YuxK
MTAPLEPSAQRQSDEAGRPRSYTVVYDGNCRVCTSTVRTLTAWDARRQLEMIPSQSPSVAVRFPWIPPSAYAESMQLIDADGRTWQGAAAIEQLLRVLPRGRFVAWLFHIPLVGRIADRAYRWFARNRYRFRCGNHCEA